MLSKEVNDLMTRVGPNDGAGKVLRRYWQPAALTVELEGERPVAAVRLMGEDLVLFRDNEGELGLIGRQCPHRGADLCYGRREDNKEQEIAVHPLVNAVEAIFKPGHDSGLRARASWIWRGSLHGGHERPQ